MEQFCDEYKEQSLVKATIVARYFDTWARSAIAGQKYSGRRNKNRIAYVDLFAGPSRHTDGTLATPLKILGNAIRKPVIRNRLVALFNDKDEDNASSLEKAIAALPGIEKLKYRPRVESNDAGQEIIRHFEEMSPIPALFVIDPWGYKGLSLQLVDSLLKNWGCDCIFFFNYNQINMGLGNPKVREYLDTLFGEERAKKLRACVDGLPSQKRELLIIEELCQALKSYGCRYTLPFRFKDELGRQTSHHLIFVSRNFHAYEIMKDIMARESTSEEQGVPSFEYSPADFLPRQSLLFLLSRPLENLQKMLLQEFAGQTLPMHRIYRRHSVDTPFIKTNYKEALLALEQKGHISAIKPDGQNRRPGTFADHVIAVFPAATG